jgi:hypothetical protein
VRLVAARLRRSDDREASAFAARIGLGYGKGVKAVTLSDLAQGLNSPLAKISVSAAMIMRRCRVSAALVCEGRVDAPQARAQPL